MFTYTCPKCRTRFGSENIRNGAVLQCKKCQQRMCVVQADESDTAIKKPRGSGCGLLLLVASALTGLVIGGVIFLVPFLFEGKPIQDLQIQNAFAQSNAQTNPKAGAGSEANDDRKPDTPPKTDNRKPDTPSKTESDPKKDTDSKKDTDPKKESDPKKGADPKPGTRVLASDELYDEMLKSCVWIVATDGRKIWTGSGSLIDRDERLVLTNQHVANRSCKAILVFFPIYRDGKLVTERASYLVTDFNKEKPANAISAEFVYDRAICDLALIRLSRLPAKVKALRLSKRKIQPGQVLHTVGGSPEGNTAVWIYSPGAVRQISFEKWQYKDGVKREAELIASSVPINAGDSGGAVVDNRGYLVGVNSATSEGVLNSRHIHVNEVRSFLQTAYSWQLSKQFAEPADEEAKTVSADKAAEWMKKLRTVEWEERKKAAIALGKIGSDAQKAAIPLLQMVRDPKEFDSVRREAATALHEIGPPELEHLKKLLAALNDKDCKEARRYAALSLGSFPEDKQKEVVEALKDALQDDDAKVRQNAAIALRNCGKAAIEEAYLELTECLRDTEFGVRAEAYQTLKIGGIPDEVSLSAVRELLQGAKDGKNPTREARYWGVFVLVRKFKEKGLSHIVEAIEKEENFDDLDFMIYVVEQLKEFRLNSLEVGTILSMALDHRHEDVLNAAIFTMTALRGNKWDDFVTPDENTVEALIKVCIKFPRAHKKLKGVFKEEAEKFPDIVKARCSTFSDAKGRLGFKSSPKLVEILSKAVDESDDLARRVAINCLERIGKDKETAKAAPDLKKALLKEKSEDLRIEIFAALAALGKAGGDILGDDKEIQEELAKWINDVRDDHTVRVMAAVAMASLYPGQKQSDKAYRVLAQALLLTNAPIKTDLIQPVQPVQMTRFGIRPVPPPPPRKPDKAQLEQLERAKQAFKVQLELHERAKQALSLGGAAAGEAVCSVFENGFWSTGTEKAGMITDKIYARISAFQVLAKIGPPVKDLKKVVKGRSFNPAWLLIDRTLKLDKLNREDTRVIAAAREAKVEIFGK